jgi:hypothetical protein
MRVQQSPAARFSNRNSKIWRRTRGVPRTRPIPRVLAHRVGRILVGATNDADRDCHVVENGSARRSCTCAWTRGFRIGISYGGQFNGLRLAANCAAPRAARTCFPAIASPLAALNGRHLATCLRYSGRLLLGDAKDAVEPIVYQRTRRRFPSA